jgi:hypothetical protein
LFQIYFTYLSIDSLGAAALPVPRPHHPGRVSRRSRRGRVRSHSRVGRLSIRAPASAVTVGPARAPAEAVPPATAFFAGALATEHEQRDDDHGDGQQQAHGHDQRDQVLGAEAFLDDVLDKRTLKSLLAIQFKVFPFFRTLYGNPSLPNKR